MEREKRKEMFMFGIKEGKVQRGKGRKFKLIFFLPKVERKGGKRGKHMPKYQKLKKIKP